MSSKSKNVRGVKVPKIIIGTAKVLSLVSDKALTLFAARLFTTPIRHKIPKREIEMERHTVQEQLYIPSIDKSIVVYLFGESTRKVLLVHGWSGRGTQLVKIADTLIQNGYSTVSFDAPAHGKSKGKTTLMPEFIFCINEIAKKYGPFESAVGHSLGGMSILNAAKRGFKTNSMVVIGSGDIVDDIMSDFIRKLKLDKKYTQLLRHHFEKKSDETMDSYSAYHAAAQIDTPVLVIHDINDNEVPVKCGKHIHDHLKNGQLILTEGLGHRKILGNDSVIANIVKFINDENTKKNIADSDHVHDTFV